MAVPKRKKLHDDRPPTEGTSTRRATRQHPTTATTDEPPKQLRSGRTRAETLEPAPKPARIKRKSDASVEEPRPPSREEPRRTAIPPPAIPSSPEETARTRRIPATQAPPKPTRQGRQRDSAAAPGSPPPKRANVVPTETPISPPKYPLQLEPRQPSLTSPRLPHAKTQGAVQTRVLPPPPILPQQSRPRHEQVSTGETLSGPAANTSAAIASIKTTPKRQARPLRPPATPGPDRNIDKVFLGNICFRAWYPSYYPKEVLADPAGTKDGQHPREVGKVGGGKHTAPQPILDRLLVCPCCFKYSRELAIWWEHVRYCERKCHVPGRKVYTHPRTGARQPKSQGSAKSRRRGHEHANVQDDEHELSFSDTDNQGEWSVWEVDGEKDGLFCQNLSLFAKLFLDNKSVFFDVTGFNYFLLVYTPKDSNEDVQGADNPASTSKDPHHRVQSRPQVVGFFSKEKVSWDNNNLACILVFPPWQRKGLGSLLMGVSYAISRREGVLGGPEKPISELGRKGYNRFWAAEVARWLLSLPASAPRAEKRRAVKDDKADLEVLVDVIDCSNATWIVPEDCLQVLRDMGLLEEAGLGPQKDAQHRTSSNTDSADTKVQSAGDHTHHASGAVADGEAEKVMVPRVRLDKAAVQKWVEDHRINLERTCDPDGFVPGYAIRDAMEVD
ncbi:acyl-CoA N-acyltransferase [Microdochium bolleyi]|uniref:Acyl-CoA N-acyltransferase n=1 Tax=Microdochium bolleyi TaxID=196109 RepID=A0A136IZT2_9PEZI|nr:acyl-CoA N-acyltransferase [Microdochium bolleyi]